MMIPIPAPARRVFRLAIPAIGELSLQSLLSMVDTLFVAQLGLLAIDAVNVTGMCSALVLSVCSALGVTVTVYRSRTSGEGHAAKGRSLVWHGILMALVVGGLVAVLSVLFTLPILHLAGADDELAATAQPYFLLVLGSAPILAINTILAACFRATGDTQTPLRVGFQMNVLHVGLDALLIFGVGPVEGVGLLGAGIAYCLVQVFTLVMYVKKASQKLLLPTRAELHLSRPLLLQMLRFAGPAVVERLFKRGGQVVYLSFVVRMGTDLYAANSIVNTLVLFSSNLGDGLATAVGVSTGQVIGESEEGELLRRRIREYRYWGFVGAAVTMTGSNVLLWMLSPWIGRWFTDQDYVVQMITLVLGIYIVCQPFFAANLIDAAAIQASGNSTYTMGVTILGVWGIRMGGIAVCTTFFKMGLPGVWFCICLDHIGRAYLYRRYRKKTW